MEAWVAACPPPPFIWRTPQPHCSHPSPLSTEISETPLYIESFTMHYLLLCGVTSFHCCFALQSVVQPKSAFCPFVSLSPISDGISGEAEVTAQTKKRRRENESTGAPPFFPDFFLVFLYYPTGGGESVPKSTSAVLLLEEVVNLLDLKGIVQCTTRCRRSRDMISVPCDIRVCG